MNVISLIKEVEDLDRQWCLAVKAEENRITGMTKLLPFPPPSSKARCDFNDEDKAHYVARTNAIKQLNGIYDEAKEHPDIVALANKRDAVARRVSDWIASNNCMIVGSVPGGLDCPKCGGKGISLPENGVNQRSMKAICESDNSHLISWVPWGG